jgi:hypothetical protein
MAGPFFVDTATGNDADDGLSEANAWLTIQKAADTAVAGEKVWIKAGTYAEQVDFDTNAGTGSLPIVFEGYTSATGDGGQFTITGSGSRASCLVFNGTADHVTIKNAILTSPTTQCILGTTAATVGTKLINVHLLKGSSTPSRAIYAGGYNRFDKLCLISCVISGGFSGNGISNWLGMLHIADSLIIDCGGHGISGSSYGGGLSLVRSIVAGNTTDGINLAGNQAYIFIEGNTIAGNGGDGIDINGATNGSVTIRGNVISDHSGAGDTGLKIGTISGTTTVECDYNFYYNNTAHRSGNNTTGDNDVELTGSPFTNAGADDWTLNNTAGAGADVRAAYGPAIDATNIGYADGGALQHQDAGGGGGGGIILPRSLNGGLV